MFRTYHPTWDPCFLCTFGHEHGSDARTIMGYTPRYGYTALKNHNQDESHNGFKDFVTELRTHYLYVGLHMHMSQPRRFTVRFHTLVVALVNKASRDLEAELRFKADYGPALVRKKKGGFEPVSAKDSYVLRQVGSGMNRHIINVIDREHLDPRWKYRSDLVRGNYERWATVPMCSAVTKRQLPEVDVRVPPNALKSIDGDLSTTTELGSGTADHVTVSLGLNRVLRFKDWTISDKLCGMDVGSGRFYTDPKARVLRRGAGKNSVAQFIKRGFELKMSGAQKHDFNGLFFNKMNGLDPGTN